MIYFDNAATTAIKPEAVYRASDHALRYFGNPGRSGHKYSLDAAEAAFNCREKLGKLFNFDDTESIVFTLNATHALNIAINSLVSKGDVVLVSGFEHNAVMRTLFGIGADIRFFGTKLFDQDASVETLKQNLTNKTKCVIVNHVSNVFGFVQPVYEIAELCNKRGVPLIIDCSQSAGVLNIDQKKLNASFLAMPGHKSLYGPQGTGVLICGINPKPLMYGGTGSLSELMTMPDFLPDRSEAGTVNMPGITGLSAGVDYILKTGTGKIMEHESELKNMLKNGFSHLSYIIPYFSDNDSTQAGVVSFNMDGAECEAMAASLGEHGIAVRAGLHCAPAAHKSAGTINTGTVRVSFSYFNTKDEVYSFINMLEYLHAFEFKNGKK